MPRKKKVTFTPNWEALTLTTYDNFPALTTALGYSSAPAGNSKIKLLHDLEARYEYERSGDAYILKARKEVIQKPPAGNNSKYVEPLGNALWLYAVLNKSYNSSGTRYSFHKSRADWQFILGMTTINYSDFMSSRYHDSVIKELKGRGFSKASLYAFEMETDQKLYDIFSTFLRSAKRQKLIDYKEQYWIIEPEHNERVATPDEVRTIKEKEAELLEVYRKNLIKKTGDEARYEQMTLFKLGYQRREFLESLSTEFTWKFYKAIRITVNRLPQCKPEGYEKLLQEQQLKNRQMIKSALLEALPKKYERMFEKAQKEYDEKAKQMAFGTLPESAVYWPAKNYVPVQTKLVEKYWGNYVNDTQNDE